MRMGGLGNLRLSALNIDRLMEYMARCVAVMVSCLGLS